MEEYFDLYLPDGTKTGEIISENQPIPENRATKLAHMFIFDQNGSVLLQKRSMRKRFFPGIWDGTGGRVQSGEDGPAACAREMREEVGLAASPADFVFLGSTLLPWRNLFEVYAVKLSFSLSDCTRQESEVDELKLVPCFCALACFRQKEDAFYTEMFMKAARLFGDKTIPKSEY